MEMPSRFTNRRRAVGARSALRHVHRENGQNVILGLDDVSRWQSLPIAHNALKAALRTALTGAVPIRRPGIDRPMSPQRSMDDRPSGEGFDLPSQQMKPAHPRVLWVEEDIEGRDRLEKLLFEGFIPNPDAVLVAVLLAAQQIDLAALHPADLPGLYGEPPTAVQGKPGNDPFGAFFRDIAGGDGLLPGLDLYPPAPADDVELAAAFEAARPDQWVVRRIEHFDRERHWFIAEFTFQRRHPDGIRAGEACRQNKIGQGTFLRFVFARGLDEPVYIMHCNVWIVGIKLKRDQADFQSHHHSFITI